MKSSIQLLGLAVLLMAGCCQGADVSAISIIPEPQKMTVGDGAFTLRRDTPIYTDDASVATGEQLATRLRIATGFPLKVSTSPSTGSAIKDAILLTTSGASANLGPEGYNLAVTADSVVIRAPAQAGLFYGAQSLLQLLPPEIFSSNVVAGKDWPMPCVQIEDQPRFGWRGMMLDVSRDFFTKPEVEELLDELALHKINVFHWHLVDNNGWRVQIEKYPKLTEIGAWREHSRVTSRPAAAAGTAHPAWLEALTNAYRADGRYGGFYTQNEIREVVAYAAALHITVVPEIEMPGHSAAALSAYPELMCDGATRSEAYCPGRDASFDFVENVLTEVFQLFPGKYIHIGGDEVNFANWRRCDLCQARMKAEGMTNVEQLQSYFIKRIEKFVNEHNRSLIGWSEIQKGGLAPSATVMDWIGGAVESARTGHDVVMSPQNDCYLDHYQSQNHATEPWAIGGFLPLNRVYAFDPLPATLQPEFQSHILGAQGNLWTEYVASFKHVQYMAFPRMCAMAEVTWSPKAERNWDDFSRRLQTHLKRLDELGVNYRPLTVAAAAPAPGR